MPLTKLFCPKHRLGRSQAAVLRVCIGLCLASLLTACDSPPRRLPYIPPELANWPQPYRGVPGLAAHIFVTGHIEVPEGLVTKGGAMTRTRQLPVQVLVIQHPREGVLLVDAGISQDDPQETIWPVRLPLVDAAATRVSFAEALPDQLRRAGIRPEAVRWVVLTNARALRLGFLHAFAQARIVLTRAEYEYAQRQEALSGFLGAAAKPARWHWIDFTEERGCGTFPASVDLLGDGSVVLLEGRGPTPGSLAVLVRLPKQPLLWAGDIVPTATVLRTASEPRGLWNADEWWLRYWRIKRFHDLAEELVVVPAFDAPVRLREGTPLRMHALPSPEAATPSRPTPPPWQRFIPHPW